MAVDRDRLAQKVVDAGRHNAETGQGFDIVRPEAAAMAEALRAFGYSTPTAIADLVDNSIFAEASRVDIRFHWSGADSYIALLDDGRGMSEDELVNAMRPGSRNPLEARAGSDLGRFGLGLKSASFSQCRRLTVASRDRRERSTSVRRWDLDYINQTSEWRLLREASPGSGDRLRDLEHQTSGTLVLWENMDRIVGDRPVDDAQARDRFLDLARETEQYLGMIFHRFMEGNNRLAIYMNGNPIKPWNPFLERNSTTQWLGEENLKYRGEKIRIQPFVLPHHSRLDPETHKLAAGAGGWNARQGFYVYRNRRLLVTGEWLGLPFTKEEHYKLARIRIDIPNTMDQDWQIDVRKSRARPPGVLRRDLERIARLTRERAVAIYRHRGKVVTRGGSTEHSLAWQKTVKHGKISYRINREHPLVQKALQVPREHRGDIRALLRLAEETVPTAAIAIDHSEHPDDQAAPFETTTDREIKEVMMAVYRALVHSGLNGEDARARLAGMDDFRNHPELIAIIDEIALQGE